MYVAIVYICILLLLRIPSTISMSCIAAHEFDTSRAALKAAKAAAVPARAALKLIQQLQGLYE